MEGGWWMSFLGGVVVGCAREKGKRQQSLGEDERGRIEELWDEGKGPLMPEWEFPSFAVGLPTFRPALLTHLTEGRTGKNPQPETLNRD